MWNANVKLDKNTQGGKNYTFLCHAVWQMEEKCIKLA